MSTNPVKKQKTVNLNQEKTDKHYFVNFVNFVNLASRSHAYIYYISITPLI